MVKYIRVIILSAFLLSSCMAQVPNREFVFPDMDRAILSFWICDDCEVSEIHALMSNISEEWAKIRGDIEQVNIKDFDRSGFVEDQDIRIVSINKYLDKAQFLKARQLAYILLSEFKVVRECFTNDDYDIDYIIEAYGSYLSVHEIIHDEMMGLYEWREFIWFVEHLKIKVDDLEEHLVKSQVNIRDEQILESIEKIKGCLKTLDDSLGDAYRPDFEMPCNELYNSFKELWKAYSKLIALL